MARGIDHRDIVVVAVVLALSAEVLAKDLHPTFRSSAVSFGGEGAVIVAFALLLALGSWWPRTRAPGTMISLGALCGLAWALYVAVALGRPTSGIVVGAVVGAGVGAGAWGITCLADRRVFGGVLAGVVVVVLVVGSVVRVLGTALASTLGTALMGRSSLGGDLWMVFSVVGGTSLAAGGWALRRRPSAIRSVHYERGQGVTSAVLIRFPALSVGGLWVIRQPLRWFFVVIGGVIVLGDLCVGVVGGSVASSVVAVVVVLWLGWMASAAVAPIALRGSWVEGLPRNAASVGRRMLIPIGFTMVAIVAAGVVVAVPFGSNTLRLSLLVVPGVAIGLVGVGAATRAIVADPPIEPSIRTRLFSRGAPLVLAACVLAPLIQWNDARIAHGFVAESILPGSLFAVTAGLVGASFLSWWRRDAIH
ncbi:MAG: hypothetical protein ACYDHP_07795 [Ferrimicrobium sp.]